MTAAGKAGTTEQSENLRFGFGANWSDFIDKAYSEERLSIAQRHLLGFLKRDSLEGTTFLDIGSGSGLHSLAAWRAGATQVTSFDYDRDSVDTTRRLHQLAGEPENWTVTQGSILDAAFLSSLPKFDIVYSWGVLHHTGDMWEAVRKSADLIDENGVFYIALYSKDMYVDPPYQYWLDVKRKYNLSSDLHKRSMEARFASKKLWKVLRKGGNPFAFLNEYKASRGMSYWHDVRDWLGGYPMDFAGNKEAETFARENLGLDLINIKAGEGNTEFLFRRFGARNYWDEVLRHHPRRDLQGPFDRVDGHAWRACLPSEEIGAPDRLMLYENESPVGWPNARMKHIAKWGKGRYRVEQDRLIFSLTDNADPNQFDGTLGLRADFL